MIFLVVFENEIVGIFFHIWQAEKYIKNFSEEIKNLVDIVRVDDQEIEELKEIKTILNEQKDKSIITNNCKNCGRMHWDNNILICDFLHEETNPNDYCIHYI